MFYFRINENRFQLLFNHKNPHNSLIFQFEKYGDYSRIFTYFQQRRDVVNFRRNMGDDRQIQDNILIEAIDSYFSTRLNDNDFALDDGRLVIFYNTPVWYELNNIVSLNTQKQVENIIKEELQKEIIKPKKKSIFRKIDI